MPKPTSEAPRHVVVIGAGIVGAITALMLAERGLNVTLVDRESAPGQGTSRANGGGITPGHAEPWNAPGIIGRLLKADASGDRPFRLFPAALPGLAGWGLRFLAESRPRRYFANARHCTRLAIHSRQCLAALRERFAFDDQAHREGSLELYFQQAALHQALAMRQQTGADQLPADKLTPAAIVELEPSLSPIQSRLAGGLLLPAHESGDACRFADQAAGHAERLGARLRFGKQVDKVLLDGNRVTGLILEGETVQADAVVLAAGVASRMLAKPLGLKLPIQAVKGYSLTLPLDDPEQAPARPLLDLEKRIVTARFGHRLRVAGLADFDPEPETLRPERRDLLRASAARLFPHLAEAILAGAGEDWTGLRPMTPRGVPTIGATPVKGLWLNTGHGAMGWTMAAGSAELLADLLCGQPTSIPLEGLGYAEA
ncbi:MAG: D-amino acid dehydrogenase [Wenzhouxiangella sp.]